MLEGTELIYIMILIYKKDIKYDRGWGKER